MLSSYLALGLAPDAGDDEIRKRYLELIKRHTPEKDPDRFRELSSAYERIKTPRARIRSRLFGAMDGEQPGEALKPLVKSAKPARKRAGLKELIKDAGIIKG